MPVSPVRGLYSGGCADTLSRGELQLQDWVSSYTCSANTRRPGREEKLEVTEPINGYIRPRYFVKIRNQDGNLKDLHDVCHLCQPLLIISF